MTSDTSSSSPCLSVLPTRAGQARRPLYHGAEGGHQDSQQGEALWIGANEGENQEIEFVFFCCYWIKHFQVFNLAGTQMDFMSVLKMCWSRYCTTLNVPRVLEPLEQWRHFHWWIHRDLAVSKICYDLWFLYSQKLRILQLITSLKTIKLILSP